MSRQSWENLFTCVGLSLFALDGSANAADANLDAHRNLDAHNYAAADFDSIPI